MRVRTRLVLLGAVVPVVALLVLALIAGAMLDHRLARELDEHLLAQAAVESIGLFDGERGEPHLHAHRSPLHAELHGLIPVGAIYRDGALLVHTHGADSVPSTAHSERPVGEVTLRTAPASGATSARRELLAAVRSPGGTRYTLYLAVSLERARATMRGYWTAAGAAIAAVALLLVLVQFALAAGLAARLGHLTAYLPRLRDGQSEPPPPPDRTGDELTALRDGLYLAAQTLEQVRAERERGLVTAAHDLRTPLGVIRTTIDLALRRARPAEELRAALAEIRGECDRLTALAEQILTDRRGPRHREPVELAPLVEQVCASLRPRAEEVGVELAVRSASASVTGDRAQLRRALENLLHNALTHSPKGGVVSLEVTLEGANAAASQGASNAASQDARCRIAVRDDGPGIAAERLEEVFQAFVRGPESRGAGLGLSIVRQIATEHGGQAWAEAGPGGRVFVELPART